MVQDLSYEKNDEIAAIAKIEQKLIRSVISKELINFLKKLVTPKRYLHLVLKEQLKQHIMCDY